MIPSAHTGIRRNLIIHTFRDNTRGDFIALHFVAWRTQYDYISSLNCCLQKCWGERDVASFAFFCVELSDLNVKLGKGRMHCGSVCGSSMFAKCCDCLVSICYMVVHGMESRITYKYSVDEMMGGG